MIDADFTDRESRYHAHMARFAQGHATMPEAQQKFLIELERQERWAQIMGPYAAVLDAPPIAQPSPTCSGGAEPLVSGLFPEWAGTTVNIDGNHGTADREKPST